MLCIASLSLVADEWANLIEPVSEIRSVSVLARVYDVVRFSPRANPMANVRPIYNCLYLSPLADLALEKLINPVLEEK